MKQATGQHVVCTCYIHPSYVQQLNLKRFKKQTNANQSDTENLPFRCICKAADTMAQQVNKAVLKLALSDPTLQTVDNVKFGLLLN